MADSQRKTANWFDKDKQAGTIYVTETATRYGVEIPASAGTYTVSGGSSTVFIKGKYGSTYDEAHSTINYTITLPQDGYILIYAQDRYSYLVDAIMLNSGSTPLPYEPYGWVHSLRKLGTSTDTLTTLPADVYADGQSATVGLVGNMSQTGTPAPTTPIQPSETGDRTGNLFDESALLNGYYDTTYYQYNQNDNYRCFSLSLQAGTYTIFAKSDVLTIRLLRVSSASLGANTVNLDNQSYTFTLPVSETIYVSLRNSTTTNDFTGLTIMLNTGSVPLPYEPYGYKIPISSANTTTPVYLGEVQSTRRIKKSVLTGEEAYFRDKERADSWRFYSDALVSGKYNVSICSHFAYIGTSGVNDTDDIGFSLFSASQFGCRCPKSVANTVNEFKAWLAQQYSAGTPVTIWYVLATPETAVVNEPLRKIGDYTDTVSGITIPTITGKDSFDVLTTLKPSEVSLAYTGWHDASVKEWDGSEWQ